jgi:hypothetical protein
MAHTLGTTQSQPTVANTTETTNPMIASFTCGTGVTVLCIMLRYAGSTARGGGAPTYNGNTMLQADSQRFGSASPECSCEVWYLLAPPITTADISVPNSGGLAMKMDIGSGVAQSGFTSALDVANGAGAVGTNPTVSVTTTVAGDILFNTVANGAQTWTTSARTGTLIQQGDHGAWGGGSQYLLMAGTGAQAMAWTFATSEDYGIITAAFKEVVLPSGPAIPVLMNQYKQRRS